VGKGCDQARPKSIFLARQGRCAAPSASGWFVGREATPWKLASYEVAGNVTVKFLRPEGTLESAVPSGRISFGLANQTRRVWLISSCPAETNGGGHCLPSLACLMTPLFPQS